MNYASVIKTLREEGRYTQRELADGAGCTTATISMVERGLRPPSLPLALSIAHFFGKDLSIFEEDRA